MFKLVVALILPCGILGQIVFNKNCADYAIGTQENFNAEKYLGKWHEQARFDTTFQKDGDCVTANYGLNPNGSIQVINNMKYIATGVDDSIEGFAVEKNPGANDGKLLVKFPESPQAGYWVLETDYEKYAVVWNCYDFQDKNLQYLWILAREIEMDDDTIAAVEKAIATHRLDVTNIRRTNNDQDDCDW